MRIGDFVAAMDKKTGRNRFWEVRAVRMGTCGHENLVELKSLTEDYGTDTGGKKHRTTWVPEPLLRDMAIYRRVENDE